MVAVQNLIGEIIQLILSRKGGAQLLLNCFLDFYETFTVVVHNLQMCMKGYLCCLKLSRGDNSTYTFTKRGVMYLVSTTPPKRLIGFL
jgi:hypothetical protein